MLKNKFNRQLTAFLTLALVSILLYPVAKTGQTILTWSMLVIAVLAALLTLMTK